MMIFYVSIKANDYETLIKVITDRRMQKKSFEEALPGMGSLNYSFKKRIIIISFSALHERKVIDYFLPMFKEYSVAIEIRVDEYWHSVFTHSVFTHHIQLNNDYYSIFSEGTFCPETLTLNTLCTNYNYDHEIIKGTFDCEEHYTFESLPELLKEEYDAFQLGPDNLYELLTARRIIQSAIVDNIYVPSEQKNDEDDSRIVLYSHDYDDENSTSICLFLNKLNKSAYVSIHSFVLPMEWEHYYSAQFSRKETERVLNYIQNNPPSSFAEFFETLEDYECLQDILS